MIVGIGVDIVETQRVGKLVASHGDRFANRILTDAEFTEFIRRKRSVAYLASRFAAKEAASKALGTGIGKLVEFKSLQLSNDSSGQPRLEFLHRALRLAREKKVTNVTISLSDEKHYAVAMVLLES